jgi:SAM-dependent methyltransferase
MSSPKATSRVDRVRALLTRVAFESLYGPFAWAYDWVSRTFFAGQWRVWQRAAIPHLVGKRVLEVGLGTGNLQIDLRRAGFDVYGVELSRQMLRQAALKARRRGLPPSRMCRARAQALPLPSGYFDSVVSTFPSEYIVDPTTVRELARVLRPGGRLVVVPGGWLTAHGAKGMALEGVARVVYGYKGEPGRAEIAALESGAPEAGWHRWIASLRDRLTASGFQVSARVVSNDTGSCLVIVAEKAR